MITKQEIKIIEKAVHDLGEHFDCVQVLVSRTTENNTERYFQGSGNHFGRLGMAQKFLEYDNQATQAEMIKDKLRES